MTQPADNDQAKSRRPSKLKGERFRWIGPLLVILGAVVLLGGIGALYLSGACGYQADAAKAVACMRRWRTGGLLIAIGGIVMLVWGARRTVASSRGHAPIE